MPGWNEFVLDAKEAASDAYVLWHQWNKPKQGPIFQLMQRSRARYKYAIRYCRQQESRTLADSLAHSASSRNFSSFWKKVSTTLSPGSTYSPKIGSAEGAKDICNMWFSHYKTLFTSVGYDCNTLESIISVSYTHLTLPTILRV